MKRLLSLVSSLALLIGTAQAQTVTTYHNDNYRSGWNQNETTLTPANVSSLTLKYAVALDEQVDAQPLYNNGTVYVVTENDTVYAINSWNGSIVASRNLGTPVPMSALPGICGNNSAVVGITSTPVIDPVGGILYLVAYTYESGLPVYRLHALSLSTLADAMTPRLIIASAQLSNGSTYNFNPALSRQRAGLVLANGDIYAAFASFCDFAASQSRGWVLGWNASTLAPLAANNLVNRQASSAKNYFLSSIWMSGYGLAADPSGDLYFSTGNSDPSGSSYSTLNLEESVVRLSNDLTTVHDYFSPSNYAALDAHDLDVSAGGVLLLPNQYGGKNLAAIIGKSTPLFLLDRDNLGGYNSSTNNVVAQHGSYNCWCGLSYFIGSDGAGRIVTGDSTGTVQVWKIVTSPTIDITIERESDPLSTGQDHGFFTSVSSNGTSNALIWAVGRPINSSPYYVILYAFDPAAITVRGSSPAAFAAATGTWPHNGANANIVPVVANGQVYVASYKQLAIWGLGRVSPDGTTLTAPSSGSLTSAAGTWTWGPATVGQPQCAGCYQTYLNGTASNGGNATKMEVANGGQLYAQNHWGWFRWNGSGWTSVSGPPGTGGGSSPNGTILTAPSSGSLTSAAGTWTWGPLTVGQPQCAGCYQTYLNGTASNGGNAVEMEVANGGQIYAQNYWGWYLWNGSGWTSVSGPPGAGGSSPDGTILNAPSSGSLTTAAGTWTWGPATVGQPQCAGCYQTFLNGTASNGGNATKMEVANGGQLYAQNHWGWYLWNGSGWTGVSGP